MSNTVEKVRLRTPLPGNWEVLLTMEEAARFFHAPPATQDQVAKTRAFIASLKGKSNCAFEDFAGKPWLWIGDKAAKK